MKWLPTCCLPYVALQSPFIFNNNLRQLLLGPELSSVPVDLCVVFAPCTAQILRKMTPHGFWDPDFETRCTKTLHVLHGSMTSTSICMQVGVYIHIIYIYIHSSIFFHALTAVLWFHPYPSTKNAPAPQLLELTLGLYWWPLGKAAVAPSRAACHTTSAAALAGSTRHCKAVTARRHNALEA